MLELCMASPVGARAQRLPRVRESGGGSAVEFECGLPAARDKLLQRRATISDEGIAMRKEEVLEVELVEEARVGSEQGALGTGGRPSDCRERSQGGLPCRPRTTPSARATARCSGR